MTDRPKDSSSAQLDQLFHMSRTAGAGTTDYSAVNVVAVVALVLGLLSFLALFGWVMLVIPVAGVLLALVALVQITRSSGTQTGRLVAVGALALSVGFSGYAIARQVSVVRRDAADQREIEAVIDRFSKSLAANDIEGARAEFDARLKERVSAERLRTVVGAFTAFDGTGNIVLVRPAGPMIFSEADDIRYATGMVAIDYQKMKTTDTTGDQREMRFRYYNGGWTIFDIPEWFPPERGPGGPPR